MVNIFQKKVLMLALYAGEIMMKSGAEIYRVEDTMTRICRACKIDSVECFVTPTGIFMSLDKGGDEDDTQTFIKRIKGTNINLDKIGRVNSFSREFTTTNMTVDEGMRRLKEIDERKLFPLPVRVLGAAMIASSFAIIFGGQLIDFFVAIVTGVCSYLFSALLKRLELNSFVVALCSCALASLIALIAATLISSAHYDPIIIGTIMIFIPGVSFTNSIRDFLSGDMVAGTALMVETILTAVALAAGAGITIKLWEVIGGAVI